MRPRIEEFQDYIPRLFPAEGKKVRCVTVQVTDACNLRCTYCYQLCKQEHVIRAETAEAFLEQLLTDRSPYISRANTSGMILDLIGGEPLLAAERMEEIVEWTIRRMIELDHPWLFRFRVSISSNGTLYFRPEVRRFLQRYRPWISFSISIDGDETLHDRCRVFPDGRGSYGLAVAAAKHWRAGGGELGSKMTLCPNNVAYTARALENLVELGYRSIFCNCVFEEGWTAEHGRALYHQMAELTDWLEARGLLDEVYISLFEDGLFRPLPPEDDQNWCGGTGDMIAVDWKGDVYPCLRYMESSLGGQAAPLRIGTAAGGVEQTQEQRETVDCLRCITRRSQSTEECWVCPIAKGCAWCSAYNYQTFGTPDRRATFICVMHRARALGNLYFWAKHRRATGETNAMENHVPEEWGVELLGAEEWTKLKSLATEPS